MPPLPFQLADGTGGNTPLDFLLALRPSQVKLGLENMERLCHRMGHPQNSLRFIHLAGTNGKGSTAVLLESVLRAAGLKTGLYTSPHLIRFNERIRLQGQEVSDCLLTATLPKLIAAIDSLVRQENRHPTFFEATTALALEIFRQEKIDIVILETGLGGRLDSTNVVTPECSVITSIGMDHTEWLGDTLEKITAEKCGIIKPQRPVVTGWLHPRCEPVVREHCRVKQAPRFSAGPCVSLSRDSLFGPQHVSLEGWNGLVGLPGQYQLGNIATAFAVFQVLRALDWPLNENHWTQGCKEVKWSGRMERIGTNPLMVIDGGHNPEGVQAALQSWISETGCAPPRIAVGLLKDKPIREILSLLCSQAEELWLLPTRGERGLTAQELFSHLPRDFKGQCSMFPSVKSAWEAANADPKATLWTGSLRLVGEIKALQQNHSTPDTLNG